MVVEPRNDPLYEIFADHANIAPITNIMYKELFAILYNNKKYSGSLEERNNELLARVANIVLKSPKGLKVSEYLREKGAATQLEIETILGIDRSTVSRTISKLKSLQLVSEPAVIGSPYKDANSRGAKVSIYLWYKADPRLCTKAQQKWAQIAQIQETDRHAVKTNTPYRGIIDDVKQYLFNLEGFHPNDWSQSDLVKQIKDIHPDLGSDDLSDAVNVLYNEIHSEWRDKP